jgi:endonuclease III
LLDDLNIDADSSYTELLCHYLQKGNKNARYLVSNLLAKNSHTIAFECLKEAITDTNISVRCNVIRVISLFPTKQEEIYTLLKTIFEDKNNPNKVRERALRSILGVGKKYNKTATVEYLTKITTDEYEELSIRQVADDLKVWLLNIE